MPTTTILSPHYDDAVLSCWHQIEKPKRQVTTIFAGTPQEGRLRTWWDRLCGHEDASSAMRVRKAENLAALKTTSAWAVDLHFLDRQYGRSFIDSTVIANRVEATSYEGTTYIVPAAIGSFGRGHPDHVVVREVGKELLRRGRRVLFYADLPYSLPFWNFDRWPERLSLKKIGRLLGTTVTLESYCLTPQEQKRKQEAFRAYTSLFKLVNLLSANALMKPEAYSWEALFRPIASSSERM